MSKVVVDLIRRLLLYKPEKRLGSPEAGGVQAASVFARMLFMSTYHPLNAAFKVVLV